MSSFYCRYSFFFFFLLTCTDTTVIRLAGPVCKKQRILNRVTSQTAVTIANIDIKIMFIFCLPFVSSCSNISPYNWFKVSHGYLLRPLHSKSNSMIKLFGEPSCEKKKKKKKMKTHFKSCLDLRSCYH